jgi:hypothetical protein
VVLRCRVNDLLVPHEVLHPTRSSRFAPCHQFRARRPAAVSQDELHLRPLVRSRFLPSSGSVSVLSHVIQHPDEQPSGNIPSPSSVR